MNKHIRDIEFTYRSQFVVDLRLDLYEDYEYIFQMGEHCSVAVNCAVETSRVEFSLSTNAETRTPDSFNPHTENRYRELHMAAYDILDSCCAYVWCPGVTGKPYFTCDESPKIFNDFADRYEEALFAATGRHFVSVSCSLPVSSGAKTSKATVKRICTLAQACNSDMRKKKVIGYYRDGVVSAANRFTHWFNIVEELRKVKDASGRRLLPNPKDGDSYILSGLVDGQFLGDFPQPYRHIGDHDASVKARDSFPDAWKSENLSASHAKYADHLRKSIDHPFKCF